MSIASAKIQFASERFLLLRLNPKRYILPIVNGAVYEITPPFLINQVARNGVPLTKVSATPTNNDEWYQNPTTRLVQVKLASAPNDTTNVLTVNYYLFYTGTKFRAIGEDPETPSVNIREWQPRIETYPTTLQSIENVLYGVFTISDFQIGLINTDRDFQNYLTDDDSFNNCAVDVWLCIDDVTNIQRVFSGVITGIDISQNIVSLTAVDTFNKFKSIASMGDSIDEISYTETGFPNVIEKDKDKPCPFIFGELSRYTTYYWNNPVGTEPAQYRILDSNQAVCVSASKVLTSGNRVWGACRIAGNLKTQSYGTITAAVNISGNQGVKLSSYANLYPGDTFKFNNGTDQYGLITHVGAFTFAGNPYDIQVDFGTALISPGDTPIPLTSFALSVKTPDTDAPIELFYDRDYTVATTATSGGNKYVEITLANNFETNFPAIGTLDPNKHTLLYRTSNTAETHGEAITRICDILDMPVNTASFTQADTDLDVNVNFSIPNFDESGYENYLKYIQDILGSTLGFLKVNPDFEVEYNLLETPSSTSARGKSLTINDATGVNVSYADIITQLIAFNPHNSSFHATSVTPSPSETRENLKAKYLHSIENVVRFRHVLETITDRIDAHLDLKSERFSKYRFATATEDIDSEINTDVQFENDIILGTSKVKDLKILTIEKSPRQTSIEASDLKGL